ncbi:MAG: alpha-mannosidase [Gemmatimonadaceae bacterium]
MAALLAGVACGRRSAPVPAMSAGACDLALSSWLVVGPFALDTGRLRLDRSVVGDPASIRPTAGERLHPLSGKRWQEVQADSLGRVDLYSVLPEASLDDRAAYAFTYIASPAKRTVRLVVESDDAVAVWLNGRQVLRHDIARELRSSADTVTIVLTGGVNRLLYKVVNQTGGFGLGGRFLSASPDPTGDLQVSVNPTSRFAESGLRSTPTSTAAHRRDAVYLGPIKLGSRAELMSTDRSSGSALAAPIAVCARRDSANNKRLALAIGSDTEPIPPNGSGGAVIVTLRPSWSRLARSVLDGTADVVALEEDAPVSRLRSHVSPEGLLTQLSRPIRIDDWRTTRTPRWRWLPSSRRDIDVSRGLDSTTRARVTSLEAHIRVPVELAGLRVDALTAEFHGVASVSANGVQRTPDSLGRIPLCAPCDAGANRALAIGPIRGEWWDTPFLRVRDPGWFEIKSSASWARYFTKDSTLPAPDSAVATQLLRYALEPSKARYHALVGQWVQRLASASAHIRRDTIDIVGDSHIDAAWLWRWREGRRVVQTTWATVTKLMAKYPDMHFAASSAQYYVWLEHTDTVLLRKIQTLARDGRWDPVGGWWVESDANIPSGESLVRQALYGQRTYQRLFGKTSRVAWLPNTFGFPWSLPQIMLKSGQPFFVTEEMRWNDTDPWPARLNTFWWEGPDGSRVFTDMIYSYDHDLAPERLAKQFAVTRDSSASRRMLTVYGVGDHGGGPTMAMLDRGRDLQRVFGFPVVRDASPDSSIARMRSDAAHGPVLRDELYLEFHRGTYTTQTEIKKRNRKLEALLGTAEAAAAIAPGAYPHDSLRAAWHLVLFNQFHDILAGTSTDSVYRDAAEDQRQAAAIAYSVLRAALSRIARALDTRPLHAGETPYVVFNPSSYARTDVVRVPFSLGQVVRDSAGQILPSEAADSGLDVLVRDVPPLGAVVVFVDATGTPSPPHASPAPKSAAGVRLLENGRLRVEIDPKTGNIARMVDKRYAVNLLLPEAGQLLTIADRPGLWDAWNIDNLNGRRTWIDEAVDVGPVESTPLGMSVTVHRQRGAAQVEERYILPSYAQRLDISFTVTWHESHELLKFVMPLSFRVDSTRAEIPYASIARPTRPRTRSDSARFETPMQRWVDASARGYGVAIVNDSKYGYSAHGDTIFVSLLRSPKSPDPQADMGTHAFVLSIQPHTGDWRAPVIRQTATSLNDPLAGMSTAPHAGHGHSTSWLSLDSSTTALGALKRAEDDNRVIVRLVETGGRATVARLHFSMPAKVQETDLLERTLPHGHNGCGKTIDVPLAPFEIETLAVEPMPPRSGPCR